MRGENAVYKMICNPKKYYIRVHPTVGVHIRRTEAGIMDACRHILFEKM